MDRQITIERKQITLDPVYGTELVTWIPLVAEAGSPTVAARFWAEVQDALPSRSESVTQGLQVARNQTRIRFRWRDDVDSSMRVTVHGDSDVVYSIVGGPAEIDGRKGMLEIVCEKISS
jgi:head-tail adaptor